MMVAVGDSDVRTGTGMTSKDGPLSRCCNAENVDMIGLQLCALGMCVDVSPGIDIKFWRGWKRSLNDREESGAEGGDDTSSCDPKVNSTTIQEHSHFVAKVGGGLRNMMNYSSLLTS